MLFGHFGGLGAQPSTTPYTLGNQPGWSFLFESGRHDGFSPDEVELILEITDDLCPDVADYEFTSVLRLRADFQRGRFAPAFQPVRA